MIRTVPHGMGVGQVVVPLVDSEMTNGKTASAKTRYEIVAIYPGGVIVRSPDAPGGLIKAGTPVHVEGELDPTDAELARLVNCGILNTSILSKEVSDASDFANRPASTGVWDYRVDPSKRVGTPRQASVICDILIESGKTEFLEADLLKLIVEQASRLNTKQDPTRVFKYYKKELIASGFLSVSPLF